VPVVLVVRINGDCTDPLTIEQEEPTGGDAGKQSVATGGPNPFTAARLKARAPNVMNPKMPLAGGKSLIVPVVGTTIGPAVLLTVVPIPVWMQADGEPIDQSIAEKLTVTPPPAQLVTERWPIIDAEAAGAHNAAPAKPRIPNFNP